MDINNFKKVDEKKSLKLRNSSIINSVVNRSCVGSRSCIGYFNWRSSSNPNETNGLCDGMDKCHLTESWRYKCNLSNQLPITHFSCDPFLVNQYVPSHFAIEFQTISNDIYKGTYYRHGYSAPPERPTAFNMPKLAESSTSLLNKYSYQQEFSRLFDCNRSQVNLMQLRKKYPVNDKVLHSSSIHENNSNVKFANKIKTLDFKVNFQEENHKINGCFYDQESKELMSQNRSKSKEKKIAPPKKKWMKNFINGKYLTFNIKSVSASDISFLNFKKFLVKNEIRI